MKGLKDPDFDPQVWQKASCSIMDPFLDWNGRKLFSPYHLSGVKWYPIERMRKRYSAPPSSSPAGLATPSLPPTPPTHPPTQVMKPKTDIQNKANSRLRNDWETRASPPHLRPQQSEKRQGKGNDEQQENQEELEESAENVREHDHVDSQQRKLPDKQHQVRPGQENRHRSDTPLFTPAAAGMRTEA